MYYPRMQYLLVFASLLAINNVTNATVQDFGGLQNNTSDTVSIDFTSKSSNSMASFAGGVEVNGSNSDSNNQFRRGGRSGHADKGRLRRSEEGKNKQKYTPIASPVPEPETYAMILAGLALIGVTARRRKLNQG